MHQDIPVVDRDIILFMQEATWAEEIRTKDSHHNLHDPSPSSAVVV